jgi:hypothetical protein
LLQLAGAVLILASLGMISFLRLRMNKTEKTKLTE